MHVDLGGYHVRDIEFSAAFDIDADKVGKDLSEAIWSGQNNTIKFADDVPHLGVPVQRGMTHDGLGKYLKEKITKARGLDRRHRRRSSRTRRPTSSSPTCPVGSEQATKWYVEQILEAGCGFVNCIPVFIAREDYWNNRFKKAGLPIVGDDIKSQVGATIVHRSLARLFGDRGVKLLRTSQLNVGGNMDFYNMLERERLESKKISKTNAVTSIMEHELPADDVYIGPSDYVPWLTDRKWAHIRLEGQAFGDVPLTAEMKLEVWDSPNSAGIVTDAVRCCKLAMNHGIGGQLDGPSSYLMKSPYTQRPDDQAREATEEFIAKHAQDPRAAEKARDGGREGRRREVRRGHRLAKPRSGGPHRAGRRCFTLSGGARALLHRPGHAVPLGGRRTRSTRSSRSCRAGWPARGHRVLVLAPSRSPELVRDSRRLIRAARERPEDAVRRRRRGARARRRRAAARSTAARDAVAAGRRRAHGRGGARARAAGLRARARAVRAERVVGRAAPLARAQRRLLPRADRAGALDAGRAPLRRAVLRPPRRAHGRLRRHARADGALLPGAVPAAAPGRGDGRREQRAPARRGRCGSPSARRRSAPRCGCSCARCAGCPTTSSGRRRSSRRPARRRRARCAAACATASRS